MDGAPATIGLLDEPYTKIRSDPGGLGLNLATLWQYRMMIWLLIVRDFKIRYRQSALGAVWIILHPFFSVVLYTFIFGSLAKMPTDGTAGGRAVPYSLFNYVGLIPWLYFSAALPSVAQSLVGHAYLVQKVYFPRILLPIYAALSCITDLIVMMVIQFGVLYFTGYAPGWHAVFLPFYVLWAMIFSLSLGLGLAALQVRYRDVGMALGYMLQLWFYATPIAYPSSALKNEYLRIFAKLNPMTWIVNGFRWAMLDTSTPPRLTMVVPFVLTLIALGFSYVIFRRAENSMVDII